MKHVLFLRWLLLISLVILGGYFCYKFDVFNEFYNEDVTKLSCVIGGIFVVSSLYCGTNAFVLDRALKKKFGEKIKIISNRIEVGWFVSEILTTLGLIGTIIGMILALAAFAGVDVADTTNIPVIIDGLVKGVATALYTTLAGVCCSVMLKLQCFNITHSINKYNLTNKLLPKI